MGSPKAVAEALAAAMLSGSLTKRGVFDRSAALIGRRPTWLRALAQGIVKHFGEGSRPRRSRVVEFVRNDQGFLKACEKGRVSIFSKPLFRPKMCPAAGPPQKWRVLPICTLGELARQLNLTPSELEWFVDSRGQEAKLPWGPLRHYQYRWHSKRDGSRRLIESPKQRLKAIQRYLVREILSKIPPHSVAHGFRARHSVRTFTKPHVKREVVLKMDLKDFFPAISRGRVLAIFLTAGYPESVAERLTGLCTNWAPSEVIKSCPAATDPEKSRQIKVLYGRPHLPQGAPTSPALANLGAYRLDCRLAGLAKAVRARYTRYADDLVFSGGAAFVKTADRFYLRVCAIALEEGFEVQTRKTRIMRASVSQRAGGVVLNERPNVLRSYYENLKAIIHNCVTRGPKEQNREGLADFRAHLAGKVAYVKMLNPKRGAKLEKEFERIQWD